MNSFSFISQGIFFSGEGLSYIKERKAEKVALFAGAAMKLPLCDPDHCPAFGQTLVLVLKMTPVAARQSSDKCHQKSLTNVNRQK
ncbi:MAG: hypothetical protein KDD10_06825 [Phaeodactylibacter sp.]|nr:hypothetical protein [Phaeodactylibacter sp.]MCB9293995.1 hypothetical protein [Lewinellaceae bacterium]